jgi:membrane fusion protein, multidrug efflux system
VSSRVFRVVCAATALAACAACTGGTAPAQDAAPEPEPIVSVTVAPIVRLTMHGYVTGWGRVEPESAVAGRPPANASIAAPVPGFIAAIRCTEGQRVTKGAILFQLDSRVADVAVQRARQAVQYAESVVQRQEQLGPGQATSQKAYQDAQQQLAAAQNDLRAAELQRQLLEVPAPIDGTIVQIAAKLGDAIDPATVLAQEIDLRRLVANVAVRSADVAQVKRGQAVTLVVGPAPAAPSNAVPGAAAAEAESDSTSPSAAQPTDDRPSSERGTVEYLGAQVDPATDTVVARVRLAPSTELRPGQFVNARILTDERPNQLAVPVESILQGASGPEVAVVQGDVAIRTPVRTGLTEGGLTGIEEASLQEGQRVVVQGAYGLLPKTRIRVIGQ